ncbi:uncharacterized protein CLUP02_03318 [Colletotrichum lupini]|uniref:PHD-type domain-containing protein n=1 Tax=Colletotrichum lupini TaxID=145971 RepID=A0A9Q8SJ46_9PEZI|nr:uncharacterized protein CLUP02_03318 [Colletotrichum lupini]UQC77846.1 hypothetical protein CLUP02_03318 [Colletotrichum lupini]
MDNDESREPPRKRLRSAQPTRRGRSRGARGGSANPYTARKESGELDHLPTEEQAPESESSVDPRALPIPAALERYKAWKAGAQHDEFCFICRQTKGLTYCITCKRSYHESCRPEESTYSVVEGNSCFFCEVCVHRNWHKDPPFLMPEMRPLAASSSSSAPVEAAEAAGATRSTKDTDRQDLSNSHQVHQNQETTRTTEASKDTLSTSARRTRTTKASHSAGREETAAVPSSSTSRTGITALPPPTTSATTAISRDDPPRSSSSTTTRAPAARKSRYTTLPTDVDAALRLLYAELETAHELRHKVGDVEGQVAQMQRELQLRNSELAVARRAADVGRVSASEMEQLRAQAALGEKAVEEAAGLRAENRSLRAELEASRERLVESERALEEWKRKLSALMS